MVLRPVSLLYGVAASTRAWMYAKVLRRKRLNAAVISVGNLSVGGTGKTPMVIWLAEKLLAQGCRVAILSRGYRGTADSSDEVELMRSRLQHRAMFGVGKDRFAEGHRLESRQAIDVFLLDDGFQHLQLARDLDIVLIDSSYAMGNQALLPAGPLRERMSALSRAGAIVFTRWENAKVAKDKVERTGNPRVFVASTKLLGFRELGGDGSLHAARDIDPGPFFAFCGIGNPGAFVRDLQRWGVTPAGHMFFADHHSYSSADVETIEKSATECGAKVLLTTEKDSWNLTACKSPAMPVYASIIDLEIADEVEFLAMVNRGIQKRGALA